MEDQQGGSRGLRGRVCGGGARDRDNCGRVGVQASPASGRGEEDAAHSVVLAKGASAEGAGKAGKEGGQDSHVPELVYDLNFFSGGVFYGGRGSGGSMGRDVDNCVKINMCKS